MSMLCDEIHSFNELLLNEELGYSPTGVLCHYTSPSGLIGILKSKNLWFTNSEFLNDKTEGTYIFDLVESCMSDFETGLANKVNKYIFSRCQNDEENKTITPYFYRVSDNTYKQKLKYLTCSFSFDNDNLSMWNYYTKNPDSVGYGLEFKADEIWHNLNLQSKKLGVSFFIIKTIYNKDEQFRILGKIIKKYNELWVTAEDEFEQDRVFAEFYDLIDFIKFNFKHPAFEFEKEVKIVARMSEDVYYKSDLIKMREQNGVFVPYLEIPFWDEYIVSGIKISPSTKQENAQNTLFELLSRYGCLNCRVAKSDIPIR